MATGTTVLAGYLVFLILAGAVIATVDRRERFVFGAGVVLLLLGLSILAGSLGAAVSFLGVAAIVAAAVPLLRQPAPST